MSGIGAAVVGTGFIGVVHVEALRRLGANVTGVVGSSPGRARQKPGLPEPYESFEAMLDDDRVRVVRVGRPGDDPGIAMGGHDACRTEPGRVIGQEGGRPAGIPAELGEPGRGRVDGVARHHPTRLSLPVRFA